MKVIEVEGKTVEDAKRRAAEELGLNADSVDDNLVEIIDEGKSGIFGFGVSRPAKIRVTYNADVKDVGANVKTVLNEILTRIGVKYIINEFHEGESKVYVEFESDDSGLIIGKKGRNLEAIQFIVNVIVSQQTATEKKIILDIEGYRAKRERAIKKVSFEAAKKVMRTGKPVVLEPMNPFERRLVHLSLQNHDKVETKSEGMGIYRKVKILPKNVRE